MRKILFLTAILATSQSFAWGNLGHEIVGDRDAIDFAPFEFDEELLHGCRPRSRGFVAPMQGHPMVMAREPGSGKDGKLGEQFRQIVRR